MSFKTAEEAFALLREPFDPKFIKWRVGATKKDKSAGLALAYLDSREVMKRLDAVCGIDGWQSRNQEILGGFICEIGIKMGGEWIWKSNTGENTDIASVKGGASDAFKRAAVLWGIGRYLYYLKSPWVPIAPVYKSYVIIDTASLYRTLPKWALPDPNGVQWEEAAEESLDETNLGFEDIEAPEFQQEETVAAPIVDVNNIMDPEIVKELTYLGSNLGLSRETVLRQVWDQIYEEHKWTRGRWDKQYKKWEGTNIPHEALRPILEKFANAAGNIEPRILFEQFGIDTISDDPYENAELF